MRLKKIALLLLLLAGVIPVVLYSSLQVYFTINFPEKQNKALITDFFKKEIRRAVKFDSARLDLFGNIVLNNFDLSMASDFNDNLSLVKCKKAYVDIRFMSLLVGDVSIDSVYCSDADVTIYKRYGISGNEFAGQFESFGDFAARIRSGGRGIKFVLVDSTVVYREMFKEAKTVITLKDANLLVSIQRDGIAYFASGEIDAGSGGLSGGGDITIKGTFDDATGHNVDIAASDIDLSLFNNHVMEYGDPSLAVKGRGSVEVTFTKIKETTRLKGKIEADSLQVIRRPPHSHIILLNDNIDAVIDLETDNAKGAVTIKTLQVRDDCVDVSLSGSYEKDKFFALTFETNTVDLAGLSNYFSPYKGYVYGGRLSFRGDVSVDIQGKKVSKADVRFSLLDGFIKETASKDGSPLLNHANGIMELNGNILKMNCSSEIGKSDMHVALCAYVKNWFPLQSDTFIAGRQNRLYLPQVQHAAEGLAEYLYAAAYDNLKEGYDGEYFLKRPAGVFFNNNNMTADLLVSRVILRDDSKDLGMLSTQWVLNRGLLNCRNFSLSGGDAQYDFNGYCNFNGDMAYLKAHGSVTGFDWGKFKSRSGLTEGMMDADFDYELSFYRVAHIIEHSKGNLRMLMKEGKYRGWDLQRSFAKYFKENGIAVDAEKLDFKEIKLNLTVDGEYVYISGLQVQSDALNAAMFGFYSYLGGYEATVNGGLRDLDSQYHSVSLTCSGKFLNPCFKLRSVKQTKELCLQ